MTNSEFLNICKKKSLEALVPQYFLNEVLMYRIGYEKDFSYYGLWSLIILLLEWFFFSATCRLMPVSSSTSSTPNVGALTLSKNSMSLILEVSKHVCQVALDDLKGTFHILRKHFCSLFDCLIFPKNCFLVKTKEFLF